MLVVRRRAGEAIVLGEDIEIEVIEISRTRVKLGIKAPRTVTARRKESLHLAEENQSAAGLLQGDPRAVGDLLRLLESVCINSSQTQQTTADK
jgi:carbon storage regulator